MVPQFDWIAHHARRSPERLAQHDLFSDRRFTYREMDERIDGVASFLQQEIGVGPGDRIASLSYNSSDIFEVVFAAQRIGAIHVLLNARLAIPELEFILNDAKPVLLIHGTDFAEAAHDLRRRCGLAHLLEICDGADGDYEAAAARPGRPQVEPRCPTDIWMLLYTSGTTGRPKGAQITYGAHLFSSVNNAMATELTRRSRSLVVLPQFHVGGLCTYALPGFHLGAASVVMRQFDTAQCLKLLSDPEAAISHSFLVPTNLLFMSQQAAFEAARFDHLVHVGVGGASAPLSMLQQYAEKGLLLQQAWGMTETCSLGTVLSQERALDKIGSSGQPVMHSQVRIVDENGSDVAQGETGEILIKGPTVTPGYWRRDDANAVTLVDGWLRTGDAAYQDDDGYFFIVDRWKDMFIVGGENVSPAEVEDVIYKHSGVAECAVIGIADDRWGEIGLAYVVMAQDESPNESSLLEHCRQNLAKFKVPKAVRFVAELPHNATGKITKHLLPRE